jgi:hypothetical protein
VDALRAEKKRAEDRADAAIRDKNLILRLRSTELAALKKRVEELEKSETQDVAAPPQPSAPPIFPTIDSITALSESLRRSDASSLKSIQNTMTTLINHPLLPELLARIGQIIK